MKENMESTRGLLFSQRVLLLLVEKGLSRERAYKIVQESAMKSWDENRDFRDLVRSHPDVSAAISCEELDSLFDYSYYVRYVDDIFKRINL